MKFSLPGSPVASHQTHPTAITHFAPMGCGHERTLASATRFLHIPAQLFAQTLAAGGEDPAEFPYRALHVVFVPGEIARAPVQACAGVILVSIHLSKSVMDKYGRLWVTLLSKHQGGDQSSRVSNLSSL